MHFSLFVGKELLTNNGLLMGNTVLMDLLQIVLLNTLNAKYLDLTIHDILLNLVKKGHFFCLRLQQYNILLFLHRSFSLWSAYYPEEIRLGSKKRLRRRDYETLLAARPCLFVVILSDLKLVGGRKTCNWLGILHKVSKIYFFQTIIHFTIFNTIISEFATCLAQNNIVQVQP